MNREKLPNWLQTVIALVIMIPLAIIAITIEDNESNSKEYEDVPTTKYQKDTLINKDSVYFISRSVDTIRKMTRAKFDTIKARADAYKRSKNKSN